MARRVAVIGAGIGGLAAAIDLAAGGCDVTVLERATGPGGKMRTLPSAGGPIDAGPTVLTLRGVFESLFRDAGTALDRHVTLLPCPLLARHVWPDGATLDLHAERDASADAIGRFGGAQAARGFRDFSARAERMWRTLEPSFVAAQRPSLPELVARAGPVALAGISPFSTLDRALSSHFAHPRLRQMFGRYATYCGSSPYAAPATLMLVAHVEAMGVWLVRGGMHRLAQAMAAVAQGLGVRLRFGAAVREVARERGRAAGVVLADGERVAAEAVLCNADAGALAAGTPGGAAGCVARTAPAERSLSALTWAMRARVSGAALPHHTVFFSDDYPAEFAALAAGRLPAVPTTYVCAQDRDSLGGDLRDGDMQGGGAAGRDAAGPDARGHDFPDHDFPDHGFPGRDAGGGDAPDIGTHAERLLCLVNAPATGDTSHPDATELDRCAQETMRHLHRCGLELHPEGTPARTGPAGFEALFPGTGGALYGPASHGWAASFRRPGARTRLPGLYLAGGSAHPGPGVPMAALSGRLAASALMADLGSTGRSARAATSGGTWMR